MAPLTTIITCTVPLKPYTGRSGNAHPTKTGLLVCRHNRRLPPRPKCDKLPC